MNEQIKDTSPQAPDQLSDILLVLDKEKKKIQAVKGIGKDGELETVDVNKKNEKDFMRVDQQGNVLSNFFSNFFKELKNPSRFSFFKVPAPVVVDTAKELQKQVDSPSKKGEELMKQHEVKIEPPKESKQETQNNTATSEPPAPASEYRYKLEQIDWETMNNVGLSQEKLEKANVLDQLLKGYKTNELVPVSINLGSVIIKMDARLSLQPGEDGNPVVAIHGIRKDLNLNSTFFGHKFSEEDKENLLATGNMGRIVDLTHPKTKETIPSIVSVDRLTNELVALRADKMKVPDVYKGVALDDLQKQTIQEGKPQYIEGMTSQKGNRFSATVQYNAAKGFIEIVSFNNLTNKVQQGEVREAPKAFRGKELNERQYDRFKEGLSVFINGLVDKEGKPYEGYIKFNKETGRTAFSFYNPDKLRAQAQPSETHKTQVAVNSEGKTNEATKNIKEPLKSGQTNPDNSKQQQQRNAPPKSTKKGKGVKV